MLITTVPSESTYHRESSLEIRCENFTYFHCMFCPSYYVVGIPSKPCSLSLLKKFNRFQTFADTVGDLLGNVAVLELMACDKNGVSSIPTTE